MAKQLKLGDRTVQAFPWKAEPPAPWSSKHSRVIIPFSAAEQLNARPGKWCHFQIVRNEKLKVINKPTQIGEES